MLTHQGGALVRTQSLRCEDCEHVIVASSYDALKAALEQHIAYVNASLDKETDEHFEMHRLDRLLADRPSILKGPGE